MKKRIKKKGKKVVKKKVVKRKPVKKKKVDKKKTLKKKTENISSKSIKSPAKKLLQKSRVRIKKEDTNKRVPTGIKKFDKLIEGGFEYDSVNLVAGGSGSGKTIFAMQFLIDGIKKGEPCLYITFEESKKEFYKNMLGFGWDLSKAESSGKFTFLEYSPAKLKMMLDEGGGAVESIVIRKKIKRLVIDSISSFTLLFDDESEKRQAILSLIDILKKWDNTDLLTLEKDTSKMKNQKVSPSELQSDSLILLHYTKIKNKRERFIEILKMRGTNHSKETYEFKIGKKGIEIGNKAGIKG